jgi:hypothetical protein
MIDDIDFGINETENETIEDDLKLIYISKVGIDTEGNNIYHFLATKDINDVWCEEWSEKPACNCRFLKPQENQYDAVFELKTPIVFVLGQESCCCSFQDVCDGCLALAYENIDTYEEYPSIRLIFYYGQDIGEIDCELGKRDLKLIYV